MLLRLTRLDERRYETVITRADGVTFHVKGVGHMSDLPHDLAHFAVEKGLGIHGGFWGSVANGAVFGSMTHVSGRRQPRASERSKQVLADNKGELTETEILVGLFNQAMDEGLASDSPELHDRLRRYTWTAPGRKPRRFTEPEVSAVCSEWQQMLTAWQTLPVGGTLEFVWPERTRGPGRAARR